MMICCRSHPLKFAIAFTLVAIVLAIIVFELFVARQEASPSVTRTVTGAVDVVPPPLTTSVNHNELNTDSLAVLLEQMKSLTEVFLRSDSSKFTDEFIQCYNTFKGKGGLDRKDTAKEMAYVHNLVDRVTQRHIFSLESMSDMAQKLPSLVTKDSIREWIKFLSDFKFIKNIESNMLAVTQAIELEDYYQDRPYSNRVYNSFIGTAISKFPQLSEDIWPLFDDLNNLINIMSDMLSNRTQTRRDIMSDMPINRTQTRINIMSDMLGNRTQTRSNSQKNKLVALIEKRNDEISAAHEEAFKLKTALEDSETVSPNNWNRLTFGGMSTWEEIQFKIRPSDQQIIAPEIELCRWKNAAVLVKEAILSLIDAEKSGVDIDAKTLALDEARNSWQVAPGDERLADFNLMVTAYEGLLQYFQIFHGGRLIADEIVANGGQLPDDISHKLRDFCDARTSFRVRNPCTILEQQKAITGSHHWDIDQTAVDEAISAILRASAALSGTTTESDLKQSISSLQNIPEFQSRPSRSRGSSFSGKSDRSYAAATPPRRKSLSSKWNVFPRLK